MYFILILVLIHLLCAVLRQRSSYSCLCVYCGTHTPQHSSATACHIGSWLGHVPIACYSMPQPPGAPRAKSVSLSMSITWYSSGERRARLRPRPHNVAGSEGCGAGIDERLLAAGVLDKYFSSQKPLYVCVVLVPFYVSLHRRKGSSPTTPSFWSSRQEECLPGATAATGADSGAAPQRARGTSWRSTTAGASRTEVVVEV